MNEKALQSDTIYYVRRCKEHNENATVFRFQLRLSAGVEILLPHPKPINLPLHRIDSFWQFKKTYSLCMTAAKRTSSWQLQTECKSHISNASPMQAPLISLCNAHVTCKCSPGRRIVWEVLSVARIHFREVRHILQQDCRFHNVVKCCAGSLQNGAHVGHDLTGCNNVEHIGGIRGPLRQIP